MHTWAENLFRFYTTLQPDENLPNDIEWLLPYKQKQVQALLKTFLQKFYNDKNERKLFLGINSGRFGAGVTGVNFTAPRQLRDFCGIDHNLGNGSELSAEFIYAVIDAYGGAEKFYSDFFIGSVCPLGFVQHGKNLNYYDDKELWKAVQPFIIKSISKLTSFHINPTQCICIGGEKNYRYLSLLNKENNWFKEIITVPHPRFIMQYKRKAVNDYIKLYLDMLRK